MWEQYVVGSTAGNIQQQVREGFLKKRDFLACLVTNSRCECDDIRTSEQQRETGGSKPDDEV